jgi:transcription initiation factor TFIIIB Brf1 subunit/transcription initiation factor TFIIB
MSKKLDICNSCGSEYEREDGYLVCTGCGLVAENWVQFADDPMQTLNTNDMQLFSSQTIQASIRNELVSNCYTTPARKMGIRVAETLAVNYNLSAEMKDYLKRYYERAINHENFFKCSLKNKEILAAVCAYITLMNYNESIAIQYICGAVGCDGYDFGQIYTQFLNAFPECKPTAKPIEELVPSVLMDYNFDNSEVIKLRERIIDIISIEKACWLVDGRSPIHLISATTYLAWKSLKPYERARVKFTQFCSSFGLRYTQTTCDRIKELNDVFIKLAKHIPIVKHQSIKIHKNNIALYIDDIIQYSNSLIYDLRRDVYINFYTDDSSHEIKVENLNSQNETKWMNSFKRKVNYDKYQNDKKQILIKENEENEEPDISDTEIDGYLRSENEIKIYKKLQKRAKRMCENSI